MRLLPCFAALVLAASPLTTQIAEACGGYGSFQPAPPRAMLVSSHFHSGTPTADGGWSAQRRSFALLEKRAENRDSWRWAFVAPRTYDSTRIRSLGAMPARTLTLVGPSGTRVVTVKHHVELAGAGFRHKDVHEATELRLASDDKFEIALDGNLPDATWHELGDDTASLGTYPGHVLGVVDVGGARYVAVSVDGAAQLFAI